MIQVLLLHCQHSLPFTDHEKNNNESGQLPDCSALGKWIEVSLALGARRLWGKQLIRAGGRVCVCLCVSVSVCMGGGVVDVSVGVNITWLTWPVHRDKTV